MSQENFFDAVGAGNVKVVEFLLEESKLDVNELWKVFPRKNFSFFFLRDVFFFKFFVLGWLVSPSQCL